VSDHPHSGTREEILRVALRLFAHRGYLDTSMDEIAKEVGISKPAIYHYFGSKEDLFRTLLEAMRRRHEEEIEQLRSRHLSLPDLLEEMTRQTIAMMKENPDWLRLMIRILSNPTELRDFDGVAEIDCAVHNAEARLINEAACDMRLRPGLTMEDFVYFYHGVIFSFIARCLLACAPVDEENMPARLRDLVLFGAFEKRP